MLEARREVAPSQGGIDLVDVLNLCPGAFAALRAGNFLGKGVIGGLVYQRGPLAARARNARRLGEPHISKFAGRQVKRRATGLADKVRGKAARTQKGTAAAQEVHSAGDNPTKKGNTHNDVDNGRRAHEATFLQEQAPAARAGCRAPRRTGP